MEISLASYITILDEVKFKKKYLSIYYYFKRLSYKMSYYYNIFLLIFDNKKASILGMNIIYNICINSIFSPHGTNIFQSILFIKIKI